jgi:hypothetical protein
MPTQDASAALVASSTLVVNSGYEVGAVAPLVATSVLTANGVIFVAGSVLNPVDVTSPVSVDFATGTPTSDPLTLQGNPMSNDLWYRVHSLTVSTWVITWAGGFDVAFEVFAGPPDEVAPSPDDLTLLEYRYGPTITVSTGEDQYYYLRIHPLNIGDNAGTGTLSWTFTDRPPGYLDLMLDPVAYDSPSWLRISVICATEDGDVEFSVDGASAFLLTADDAGNIVDATVAVGDLTAGSHSLTAVDLTSSQEDVATFDVVLYTVDPTTDPPPSGPGTAPSSDPVVRWVFEVPGGPSYTFPNNPSSMSTPHASRAMAMESTSAQDGQSVVFEGAAQPVDWNLEGFCFEQAHADALETWQQTQYRFWVVDHLQRAWLCSFESLDWTYVKDSQHPWAMRYRIKLWIFDGPVTLT